MSVFIVLWRNVRWRIHNSFTVVITILQPMLWLVLYSAVAGQTMSGMGIGNYTAFVLPGLIVLVSFGACSSSGMMNFIMKSDGSFYRMLIAPISRLSVVMAQMLEAVLCTSAEIVIMCAISMLFSVSFSFTPAALCVAVLLIFMTAFFMAGICYAVSLSMPDEAAYETVMNAIVLPVFFLSSALFPADKLAGGMKVIINLNPFTHVINLLRSIILTGDINTKYVAFTLLMLGVMGCLSLSWAVSRLKAQTDR